MRRQGSYDADSVPTFTTLVRESTEGRAALMKPLVQIVVKAQSTYDQRCPNVHGMKAINLDEGEKASLIDGYDGRSAAIKRLLANMLDSLPEVDADLCPYCSLNQNPDLDHYLPKDRFPEFSLYGPNLIPICPQCNRKKAKTVKNKQGGRIFLHAAFEPSIDQPILQATVDYSDLTPVVTYRIEDHNALPAAELAVVQRHFARLDLGGRYRNRAHSALASLKNSLRKSTQAAIVRALDVKIEAASLGKPDNDWEAALFRFVELDRDPMLEWLAPE